MKGVLLGFDFGNSSIGVAIGQSVTRTASPLRALKAHTGKPDWREVECLLREWQPETAVVGLPLNMDGTEQPLTDQARKFARQLQGHFGLHVILHDERLSTKEARAGLFARGGYRALEKGRVDSASAVIILESYFNNQ